MGILGAAGLLVGILSLILLAYRGVHVLIVGIISSLVVILTSGLDIWNTLVVGEGTGSFATGAAGFISSYFLMFLLGAILGELLSKSGYAKAIAYKLVDVFGSQRSILVVLVATVILSYGGVSVFVIVFAIYPVALYVFQEADMPKRLIPGVVMLGAGTFTMTCLPGTPALTNVIPTSYIGTTIWAAPVLGIILSAIMFVLGYLYLTWEGKRMQAAGEHFVPGPNDVIEAITEESRANVPSFALAVLPIIIIFVVNMIGTRMNLNSTYAVCIGLFTACVYIVLTAWKRIDNKKECINKGATGSILALFNTASVVGFGGVVKAAPAFSYFLNLALGLSFTPIISATLAVAIIAGITTSSSGTMAIFMEMLGAEYLAKGVNPQILHRLCCVAAGTIDSLPHGGPNVTFLMVTGLTYKEAYKYMFVITCIIPIIALVIGIGLAMLGVC